MAKVSMTPGPVAAFGPAEVETVTDLFHSSLRSVLHSHSIDLGLPHPDVTKVTKQVCLIP